MGVPRARGPVTEAFCHVYAEPLAAELVRKSCIGIQRVWNLLVVGWFRRTWEGMSEDRQGEAHDDRCCIRLAVGYINATQIAVLDEGLDKMPRQEMLGL